MAARGKWKPSPPALIAWFDAFVEGLPGIERRKMFGYPAAFVGGKLFAGLYQDSVLLKLPAVARTELSKRKGAVPFEPRPGRTMGEFVLISPSWVKQTAKLRPWLEQAHAYVKSLPPKAMETRPRNSHAKRNKQ
jgi:TfoX/Sxy family transcriptional regulator of competence genes